MPNEFDQLEVYQEARRLRQRINKLVEQLPDNEQFILNQQMRRAALSVTNNIAEGHGTRSYRHEISYLYRSRGSINELMDDIGFCEDQEYFKTEHLDDLRQHVLRVVRLINGYIAYLRKRSDNPEQPIHGFTDSP